MDIPTLAAARGYTRKSLIGLGALRGSAAIVKKIVHQDGVNIVTFEWTGTDGTKETREMTVYDGTPIFVYEPGNTYHYGDLVIYESQFYRCIVENNDSTFDQTHWNGIGSPDGNYDIIRNKDYLPARFTAADKKLFFAYEEDCFYFWNGYTWTQKFKVDDELDSLSTNAVQNKIIYEALAKKQNVLTEGDGIYIDVDNINETTTIGVKSITTAELENMWSDD